MNFLEAISTFSNNFVYFAATEPWYVVSYYILQTIGWAILLPLVWAGALIAYLLARRGHYLWKNVKWCFLAIDVPKANEQTPKAVENIFNQLSGSHKTPDYEERNWHGHMPYWFSFEIVSIEGYIQFIIGTPRKRRDLIESIIYAQYPDAEITEVEDYTKSFPTQYPDKEWEVFGAEYVNAQDPLYPIKTYEDFEHAGAEEGTFKDPMAAFLEVFTRMGRGEHLWVQFLVKPLETSFLKAGGLKLVKKLIGAKVEVKAHPLHALAVIPGKIIDAVIDAFFTKEGLKPEKNKNDAPHSLMLFLSPGEKEKVEAVEHKIDKLPFGIKIRFIYIARHEVFNRARVSYGLTGAFKQYTSGHNGIKPESKKTMTKTHFFFKQMRDDWRRTKIVSAYKNRSRWIGILEWPLNAEELATLWHFPILTVKAPLLKKTEAKRVEPPISLPVEGGYLRPKPFAEHSPEAPPFDPHKGGPPKGSPPSNLPV